jgi:hypothetical protein
MIGALLGADLHRNALLRITAPLAHVATKVEIKAA